MVICTSPQVRPITCVCSVVNECHHAHFWTVFCGHRKQTVACRHAQHRLNDIVSLLPRCPLACRGGNGVKNVIECLPTYSQSGGNSSAKISSPMRKQASGSNGQLLFCVAGIFTCYLLYGYVQVSVSRHVGSCLGPVFEVKCFGLQFHGWLFVGNIGDDRRRSTNHS